MHRPLYEQGQAGARREPDGHRGLWHERFFDGYPEHWQPDRDKTSRDEWATAKTAWINSVAGKIGDHSACAAAVQRIADLCLTLNGDIRVYAASWHFATGLGNPHPVENGFLWHPTLGMPYIPGAAVKGLVRAWVEAWMEPEGMDEQEKESRRLATLYHWFGSEDKDFKQRKELRQAGFKPPHQDRNLDTETGAFIFFDALPVAPVTLKADVMTPHMGKWYEKGGEIASISQSDRIPADWHDPNPVCFLVADKPVFQFAVAPRSDVVKKEELRQVMDALGHALEWLGAGAKTAVGYGIMNRDEQAETNIRTQNDKRAETARQEAARQAERERMDPFERQIADFLDARPDKNQSEISALISAVKLGRWPGEERRRVALWLETKMKATPGEWKPQSQARRPERDRAHQNTLLVTSWLKEPIDAEK